VTLDAPDRIAELLRAGRVRCGPLWRLRPGARPDGIRLLDPRVAALAGVRVVDARTAAVLESAERATRFSVAAAHAGQAAADPRFIRHVAWLVLQGALAVEVDGTFLSGAGAIGRISASGPSPRATTRAGGCLTRDALRHGAAFTARGVARVADALYGFGRLPNTAEWRRRVPTPDAVGRLLRLDANRLRLTLDRYWQPSSAAGPASWRGWYRTERPPHDPVRSATHKLYAGVAPEVMADALGVAVGALASAPGVVACKVACTPAALLRPDRFVVYFASADALHEGADRLAREWGAVNGVGVPLTAHLEAGGGLSWGIDPPRGAHRSRAAGASWRAWVSRRLAALLVTARATGADGPAAGSFALDCLAASARDAVGGMPNESLAAVIRGMTA
jgi:hypothetical protein